MMNKLKITNKRNVFMSLGIILLSIMGIIHTYIGGGWSKTTGEAAKMYPRLIYCVLILIALYIIISELLGKVSPEPPAITMMKWWQPFVMLGVGVAFFYMALYVGPLVAIIAYLFAMICMFDEDPKKHIKKNIIVTVVASIALWLIFTRVLPVITLNKLLI